jgi:SIR2-like domain
MDNPPHRIIAEDLNDGLVVPFFGAAASAICRPEGESWALGKPFLPFGSELAMALADYGEYGAVDAAYASALEDLVQVVTRLCPGITPAEAKQALDPVLRKHVGGPPALALIASWLEEVRGHRRAVDRKLRECFAIDCAPGLLHEKLAGIEGTKLYVTTNYDDLLEKALAPRVPRIVVDRGPNGLWAGIVGEKLKEVSPVGKQLDELLGEAESGEPSHPIVFKIHGSVDKADRNNDSYIVSEEDYVDFLGRPRDSYIPAYFAGLMRGKSFLFLGYSLEDWNVRVILRKLLRSTWKLQRVSQESQKLPAESRSSEDSTEPMPSWAIVRGRSHREQQVWAARGVQVFSEDLAKFAEELGKFL